MRNPFVELRELLSGGPLQVGTVTAYSAGTASIELPGGGTLQARGEANVGDKVYVRDGLIEGIAPALTIVTVTV